MAKQKRRVASLVPDEMLVGGGGLPDKFTGVIESVRSLPWRYPNKPDMDPIFAYRIRIRPDEEQEDEAVLPQAELEKHDGLVEQHYSCGKLEQFVPSLDGDEPVDSLEVDDEESEGYFAIPTEEFVKQCERKEIEPELNNGTNWADWLQRLLDAKFPLKMLKEADGDARVFEGLHARFDRVAQKNRSGMASEAATGDGGQQRARQLLVVTQILDLPGKGKKAGATKEKAAAKATAKAGSKKGAAAAEENGAGDEVTETVTKAIIAALKKADDNVLPREDLKQVATRAAIKLDGNKKQLMAAALAVVADDDYFESAEDFHYDEEEGTVTLLEA